MIHPTDQASLQRMTGMAQLTPEIEAEYANRIAMYHADGNSGPLGSVGIVDLLRFLGIALPKRVAAPAVVEWRELPQDGSVRIEAQYFGSWQPGVFLGFVAGGTLAIRLDDDDDYVREAHPSMVRVVRVATAEEMEQMRLRQSEIMDARQALAEGNYQRYEEARLRPVRERERAQARDRELADVGRAAADAVGVPPVADMATAIEPEETFGETDQPLPETGIDWMSVVDGARVWAPIDGGDMWDATFKRVEKGGLVVLFDGESEERNIPAVGVYLAEAIESKVQEAVA